MRHSVRIADARRSVRFWAPVVLALLAAFSAAQIDSAGPGWALAVLAMAAPIYFILRYPRPRGASPDRATKITAVARLLVFGGLVVAMGAFAISRGTQQQALIGSLCEGQSAQMGEWNFALPKITPVAGPGFTALQSEIAARRGESAPLTLNPQLRAYFALTEAVIMPSRARRWDGDLSLSFSGYDTPSGCIKLSATWRPFAVWASIGLWLAALGAALLALVAASSLRWRANARERIAMRREDRPLPGARAARTKVSLIKPVAALLVTGLVVWLAIGRPDLLSRDVAPVPPAYARGAAMVAARQSLLDGPANLNRWIVIGDAMARRGNFGDAAEVLLGAVQSTPRDPQGWLALGDALYGHARGQMSPAALLAYQRADGAVVAAGAPPLMVGTAMERSGRSDLALLWWKYRLSQAPRDATWRTAITARIAALQTAGTDPSP